jgi:hypothetical protein
VAIYPTILFLFDERMCEEERGMLRTINVYN